MCVLWAKGDGGVHVDCVCVCVYLLASPIPRLCTGSELT